MINEWLFVRAVRYQWLAGLVAFACFFGAVQPFRNLLSDRMAILLPRTAGSSPAAMQSHWPVRVSPESKGETVASEVSSANDELTEVPTQGSTRLTSLLAYRRGLDRQIAGARQRLRAISGESQSPVITAPTVAVLPSKIVRSTLRADDAALRSEIDEQRVRVETLRAIDTDLHPDLIEAREKLSSLQRKLAVSARRSETPVKVEVTAPQELAAVSADPLTTQAMPELAELIQTRARVDRNIKEVTAATSPRTGSSQRSVPLLDSSARENRVLGRRVKSIEPPSLIWFEITFALISAFLSLMVALIVEQLGDHIAGPLSLNSELPDAVVFFQAVPRMRG